MSAVPSTQNVPVVEVDGTADQPSPSEQQWLRHTGLLLIAGQKALDMSEMHFTFSTVQQDEESPNNVSIRVYNLSDETVKQIQGEYSQVVLQAGYDPGSNYGIIFLGTVKQYRVGKESDNLSTYLDILAADGDIGYNFGVVSTSLAAGATYEQKLNAIATALAPQGLEIGQTFPSTGGTLPRGKVLFGMGRSLIRGLAQNNGSSWHIKDGKINITPLTGYLPGEAVVLTAATGLIGRVEQTEEGLKARCLLNPRITCGQLVKIDNKSVNQTTQAQGTPTGIIYNRYKGIQNLATVTNDGLYRVYVVEHSGDTRGNDYYSDMILLSIDPTTNMVEVKNG